MTRRCDRCGHPAVDAVGTRQACLFDVPADPRATDAARAELRAGRVLCSACQRTDDLPGMAEADAAATAQFYADQAEEDRVDAELDAARIRAAQARVDELGRISEQDHAILDAQRREAVKLAQGWRAAHPAGRCTGCNTSLGHDAIGSLCPECDRTRVKNGGLPC